MSAFDRLNKANQLDTSAAEFSIIDPENGDRWVKMPGACPDTIVGVLDAIYDLGATKVGMRRKVKLQLADGKSKAFAEGKGVSAKAKDLAVAMGSVFEYTPTGTKPAPRNESVPSGNGVETVTR